MKKISFFLCMFLSVNMFAQSGVATFENEVGGVNVAKADTCWQGADAPVAGWNNWKSGDYNFQTYFDNSYGVYYSAFTVTNETANTFASLADAYRSANGGAYAGQNFAVWNMNYYGADTVTFAAQTVPGFFVNNTAYAVTSMCNGDDFAKKFTADDWFVLYCIGVKNGVAVDTVEVDLASEGTYIAAWTYVDLSELGEIDGLTFSMNSSDASQWGMNTPAYFAMDNFGSQRPLDYEDPERATFPVEVAVATFENEVGGINVAKADTCWQGADAPVAGWNNWKSGDYNFQTYFDNSYGVYYSAFTVTNETANTFASLADAYRSANGGAYAGENFAVWNMNYYGADTITFAAQTVPGFFVNNTAYAVTSMCNGDDFAKKFTADDWFVLYCIGVKNGVAVDTVEVDLASEGTYIAAWTYVDLSELGEIDGLTFSMNSSDASQWGMNTPAYFAMDNFGSQRPLDYEDPERAEFPTETTVENNNVAEKAVKALRNGQVLIIRGEKVYTVTGQRLQ